jgi:hypothetical protein
MFFQALYRIVFIHGRFDPQTFAIWQKSFNPKSTVVFGFKNVRFKISLIPKWKNMLNDVW